MAYNKITIATQHLFTELDSYNSFLEKKKAIQSKYPSKPWDIHSSLGAGNHKDPYTDEWWNDWTAYKKEITDLILEPSGDFQQFVWELISEKDEEIMDRRAKGVKRSIYY